VYRPDPRRRHRPQQATDPGRAGGGPGACAAPGGFTVADLAAKVQAMTRQTGYTIRQAAYDLRKLRATRT